MKTIFYRILVVLVLIPGLSGLADEAERSRLLLAPDFAIRETTGMPGASRSVGLSVQSHEYPRYHAVEWQVAIEAPAGAGSLLFDSIQSADCEILFPADTEMTLHWSQGSHAEVKDFQPRQEVLLDGQTITKESFGGRSSDGVMPYFNIAGEGGGVILAVGWPGDWQVSLTRLNPRTVSIRAGLKRSHFRLAAGERLRLPSIMMMAWKGNVVDGQNQFRRLMLEHFTPKDHSPSELMPVAASVHGMIGFNDTNEQNLKRLAAKVKELEVPVDTFWLDAGWNIGGFPAGQGNTQAAPDRFPDQLKSVGKAVDDTDRRFLVWFEPERAMRGTEMDQKHPEWLLKPTSTPDALRYQENDGFLLFDFGNSEARKWAVELVSKQIADFGVEIYRQDFNLYPSFFWHTNEAPESIGLTEVRFVNGLLEFWDELRARHPGLIIDNCASGGRRLDFESMRRSVVLWRSDSCWGDAEYPRNVQAMTHGLSNWLPLHGLGAASADTAALRSGMGVCGSFAINYDDPSAVEQLRRHLARYLPIRMFYSADYYPLVSWNTDPKEWLAFQFHREGEGGVVQAFCGKEPNHSELRLTLKGLGADHRYRIEDWDRPDEATELTGAQLMKDGIVVHATAGQETAIVIEYRRVERPR
ncbi:MAG: alpha-galactosidase [Planctomyces sp.]|nr:alpha-galactosidase [Planctomyces sp.]